MRARAAPKRSLFGGISLLAFVTILALPVLLPSTTLATEVLIFAMAALACNLLLGYTGLLSFGQGIFFGTGAYVGSLAMIHGGAGLATALVCATGASAGIAGIVGALSIRRSGIYFVMLTLAFSQMAYFIAYTLSDWTGGDNGLLDVPRPDLLVGPWTLLDLSHSHYYYAFVAVLFMVLFVGARRVIDSPFGSTLIAIRENNSRAIALGYATARFKLLAFTLSGAVTGLAGVLYAMLLNFAPLSNIELAMSETILIMTIIGGTGSLFGSLLGAGVIIVVGDLLSAVWPRWLMALGFALILVVLFMRGGLWGGLELACRRFNEAWGERIRRRDTRVVDASSTEERIR